MPASSPVPSEVRALAQTNGLGGYRRSFQRSAVVALLQGKFWQVTHARRSPVHLFQAGLVAGPPGRPEVYRFGDVAVTRAYRKHGAVQVVYTVRRRSDGRVLSLENVLHVQKLVDAVLAGPHRGVVDTDEAAAAAAAARSDAAEERAELRRLRLPVLLLLSAGLVLMAVGVGFLTARGGRPTCGGQLMTPDQRCAVIDGGPGPESYSYEEMQRRRDSRNRNLGVTLVAIGALCVAPTPIVFNRRREPATS